MNHAGRQGGVLSDAMIKEMKKEEHSGEEHSYIYGKRACIKRRADDNWELCITCLTRVNALEVVPHTCEGTSLTPREMCLESNI